MIQGRTSLKYCFAQFSTNIVMISVENYGEKQNYFFCFHVNGDHLGFYNTRQATYNKTVSSNAVKRCTHVGDI